MKKGKAIQGGMIGKNEGFIQGDTLLKRDEYVQQLMFQSVSFIHHKELKIVKCVLIIKGLFKPLIMFIMVLF